MDPMDDRKHLYEQGWCGGPAIVDGHKIACDLPEHHEGDCIATVRKIREHRRGGEQECVRSGCGL